MIDQARNDDVEATTRDLEHVRMHAQAQQLTPNQPGDAAELRGPLPERLRGLAVHRRHWRRRQQLRRLSPHIVRHGERQRRRRRHRALWRHVHGLPEPGLDAGDGHGPADAAAAGAVHWHCARRARVERGAQEVLAVVG